jgi:tetratricopeptide (TPR) repeat protein
LIIEQLDQALELARNGDAGGARRIYRAQRKHTPGNIDELAKLGLLAAALGDIGFAQKLSEDAIDLEPVGPYSYCLLGDLYNCLGMYNEAVDSFAQAVRMNPVLAPYGLAHAFEMQGKFLKADNVLDALCRINDKSTDAQSPERGSALLLCAMPKSGGTTISDTLRTHGEYGHSPTIATMNINRMPYSRLAREAYLHSVHQPVILHTHLVANQYNMKIIRDSDIDRILVHLRDPRQAVISYFHHSQSGLGLGRCLAENDRYLSLGMQDRLIWFLRYYYPLFVNWASEWVKFEPWAEKYDVQLKITTFEQMIGPGQDEFLRDIFDFLGVPPAEGMRLGKKRYRKGLQDEWKAILDERVQQWLWNHIPAKLIERFGWTR